MNITSNEFVAEFTEPFQQTSCCRSTNSAVAGNTQSEISNEGNDINKVLIRHIAYYAMNVVWIGCNM